MGNITNREKQEKKIAWILGEHLPELPVDYAMQISRAICDEVNRKEDLADLQETLNFQAMQARVENDPIMTIEEMEAIFEKERSSGNPYMDVIERVLARRRFREALDAQKDREEF